MKKFAAALLVLCIMLCLAACGNKTQTIYVQTESLRTVYGKEIRTEYTYSSTGRRLTTKIYIGDKLYSSTSVRTSNGITYMTVTDSDGNQTTQSYEYIYDEAGNVTQYELSSGGNVYNRVNYTYDENGNCLTTTSVTASGTTLTEYTYDDSGNLMTCVTSCQEDGTYVRLEYTYNSEGNITLEEQYDADGVLQSYIEFAYEDDNKVIVATEYNGDRTANGTVVTYVYDEHENLIEKTTTIDDEVAEHIVNTYEALEVPVEE